MSETLVQWFSTRVPQRGVRDASKFGITAFLLMFYYIRWRQIFKDLEGAANQNRLKNTALVKKKHFF